MLMVLYTASQTAFSQVESSYPHLSKRNPHESSVFGTIFNFLDQRKHQSPDEIDSLG
tara:strand:- start:290 stop:460 length:171 start_codon:yes stop_codon:yes gene_type:complete